MLGFYVLNYGNICGVRRPRGDEAVNSLIHVSRSQHSIYGEASVLGAIPLFLIFASCTVAVHNSTSLRSLVLGGNEQLRAHTCTGTPRVFRTSTAIAPSFATSLKDGSTTAPAWCSTGRKESGKTTRVIYWLG